jgi:GxxExxY protein
MDDLDAICRMVIDTSFKLHRDLGPGMLETVYEQVLAAKLQSLGLSVVRQKPIDIVYENINFDAAFRADLIVNGQLLVEIKSIEALHPVHMKQVVTYLRLLHMPVGLLINFGGATFKGNARRVANGRMPLASSRLGESIS